VLTYDHRRNELQTWIKPKRL